MILVSSSKYAEALKKLREAGQLSMNTVGAERKDDAQLNQIDRLLTEIIELLHPATDTNIGIESDA